MQKTPNQWLERGPTQFKKGHNYTMWFHILDMIEHVLQEDTEKTFFKNTHGHEETAISEWRERLSQFQPEETFEEMLRDVMTPEKRWKKRGSNSGNFSAARWADRNNAKGKFFDKHEKSKATTTVAKTIVFDMAVPWCERGQQDLAERYRIVANVALECEARGIPCRVIAATGLHFKHGERFNARMFFIVKDYNERIYPAAWACLKHNDDGNGFINAVADYFFGTYDDGNGQPFGDELERDFSPDEEVILINSKRFTYRGERDNSYLILKEGGE